MIMKKNRNILLSLNMTEISFRTPLAESKNFPALFEELEEKQLEYGILSMAVSVTVSFW